jgi:hypothetical protein
VAGPRNDATLGDYSTLDLRIARDIRVSRGSLTAFVEVTNVFDNNNDCCTEYELEGIEEDPEDEPVTPNLDLEPVNFLPRLPSIGFTWRF